MILKLTRPKAARTISLKILLDTGITIAERFIVIALLTVPIKKIMICSIYATGCLDARQSVEQMVISAQKMGKGDMQKY